jgi:multimeric flavodoxin WrbA
MKKVVGLFGSPRRGGNSEKLLDRFLAGAKDAGGEIDQIHVAELGIRGWTPDVDCADTGADASDDPFQQLSRDLVAADVIVVASPVYFRNVPAQLKGAIDRAQCQWIRKYVDEEALPNSSSGHERRRGVLISTGGNEHEHFAGTINTIKSFFDVYETDYWGELLFGDVDAQDEIADEKMALQEAYDLGFRAVAEAWG